MKRNILAYLVLVSLFILTSPAVLAAPGHQQQIVATVNDDVITSTDVKTRLALNTGGQPIPESQKDVAFNAVLDELINDTLQKQEARKLDITIEDERLEEAFADVAAKNNMSPEQFKAAIQSIGIPADAMYDKLETQLAWGQVVRRKLRPKVDISERDIDAALQDQARSAGVTQYRLAEILLKTSMLEDSEPVRDRLEMLRNQIGQGAPFPQVAQRYSEAPGASRGGDLGWVTLDQLDPSLQEAVLNLQTGQLSPVIETADGYHLLLLIDKRTPGADDTANTDSAASFEQDDTLQVQQIFIPLDDNASDEMRVEQRQKLTALKTRLSSCADMRAAAKDYPSPLTGDLGAVSLNDLPKNTATALKGLQPGTLSAPLENSKGLYVVMSCAPQRAGDMAAAQAEGERDEIANSLGMQRLDGMQKRYLRDLRAAAYIDRRVP